MRGGKAGAPDIAPDTRQNAGRMRFPPSLTRRVALAGLGGFLVIVGALHLLEPALDPSRHVISEYANTRSGWLMSTALLCWASSLFATAVSLVWPVRPRPLDRVAAGLLVVAVVGLLVAAVFRTQAIDGIVPPAVDRTTGGRLHDAGSGLSTVALFAAAATVALMEGARSRLGRVSLSLVVFATVVQVGLLIVGPEVGGVRQRLLVLGACAWQAALLRMTTHATEPSP